MSWIIGVLTTLSSSKAGQETLLWLASLLWKFLKDAQKEIVADVEIKKMVNKALDEYEKVLKDQNAMSIDGLTEDEKNEIRRRKIAIQTGVFNNRP